MASAYGLAPITTPGDQSPAVVDVNQDARILGVSIMFIIIPTTVVFLRFIARLLSKVGLWWDDWLVLLALLCSLGLNALQIYTLSTGFGRHMASEGDILNRINVAEFWFKLFYAYESLYVVSVTLAKLSILLFYSRIFKEKRFLLWVKLLIILVVMNWLAAHLTIIMECLPIQALWDPTVSGTCINLITFFVATGAVNVALDAAILVLPLPMIWSLEIERHHKYALSGVFLLGSFVVVVAIVRTVVMSQIAIVDITWEFVNAALWTAGEPSIAVTSASLPILRSLWIWNRRKRTDRYGAETPDSYEEPKTMGGPGGGRRSRNHGFRKQGSLESAKYPLNDLPAGVQQVFGNRVTVASNGRSRKLSDETDAYADLPIMHPQEAGMSPFRPPQPPPHITRPEYVYPSQRSSGLPSNRSELYG